jgi:hypothetical protein
MRPCCSSKEATSFWRSERRPRTPWSASKHWPRRRRSASRRWDHPGGRRRRDSMGPRVVLDANVLISAFGCRGHRMSPPATPSGRGTYETTRVPSATPRIRFLSPRAFGLGFLRTPPHGERTCPSPSLRLRDYLAPGLPPRSFCAMPGTHAPVQRRRLSASRCNRLLAGGSYFINSISPGLHVLSNQVSSGP